MTQPVMTLQEIRLAAQERADMVTADSVADADRFVTVAEWNRWINGSLFALYDRLVAAYGTDYYATSASLTTDGTSDTFALESDFYKLLGVDLVVSTGANGSIRLHPFTFGERNRFSPLGSVITDRDAAVKYRLKGNYLWLTPRCSGGRTITYHYVPRMAPLVDVATITLGDEWGDAAGTVSGDAALTFAGNSLSIGVWSALSPTAAATSIAASIESEFGTSGATAVLGITATASLGVITLTIPSTVRSIAFSSDTEYAVCSTPRIAYGSTSFDGFSGWLDYVVLDAARKALQKGEQDTSDLVAELRGLEARISALAQQRDPGSPATVSDVYDDGVY